MFVDTIQINLLSGSGGSGSVSFSSKSSKTSPNGANGGNGGSIIFVSDSRVFDYSNLKSKGSFKAENGGDASKNLQNGPNGKDMYLKIPIGTSIISDGELLAEIIDENVEYKICQGGMGGRGNKDLISKRNPNPEICESGEKRRKITLDLELSLLTDVALIGLPNAGKSSLIQTITNSNSKIDSYPFTTVSPSLGVYENNQEIVTLMTVGDHPEYLAVGYLLNQNMLKKTDKIKKIEYDTDLRVVIVRTSRKTNYEEKLKRKITTSGCAIGTVFGDVYDEILKSKIKSTKKIKHS